MKDFKENLLEGVDVAGIGQKDKKWCVTKYLLLLGITLSGPSGWTDDALKGRFYGDVMVALEKRITGLGGTVIPMESASM